MTLTALTWALAVECFQLFYPPEYTSFLLKTVVTDPIRELSSYEHFHTPCGHRLVERREIRELPMWEVLSCELFRARFSWGETNTNFVNSPFFGPLFAPLFCPFLCPFFGPFLWCRRLIGLSSSVSNIIYASQTTRNGDTHNYKYGENWVCVASYRQVR